MKLRIYQPDDYELGAYKVEASLSSREAEAYAACPISFHLPELPKRLINPLPSFIFAESTKTGTERHGIFVDGKWEAHVYTNGIEEKENPTSIDEVEKELRESISNSIQFAVDAYAQAKK